MVRTSNDRATSRPGGARDGAPFEAAGFPNAQRGLEHDRASAGGRPPRRRAAGAVEEQPRAFLSELVLGQVDGGEARRERVEPRMVVAGDDGDVVRATQ